MNTKIKNKNVVFVTKLLRNNLIRDFHINTAHQIEVLYSCEKCEANNIYELIGCI